MQALALAVMTGVSWLVFRHSAPLWWWAAPATLLVLLAIRTSIFALTPASLSETGVRVGRGRVNDQPWTSLTAATIHERANGKPELWALTVRQRSQPLVIMLDADQVEPARAMLARHCPSVDTR